MIFQGVNLDAIGFANDKRTQFRLLEEEHRKRGQGRENLSGKIRGLEPASAAGAGRRPPQCEKVRRNHRQCQRGRFGAGIVRLVGQDHDARADRPALEFRPQDQSRCDARRRECGPEADSR